jgi:hypothetical protein
MDHISLAHSLHEVVPEVAIVAILAVAALKLRNGESREKTKAWVVTQMKVAEGTSRWQPEEASGGG